MNILDTSLKINEVYSDIETKNHGHNLNISRKQSHKISNILKCAIPLRGRTRKIFLTKTANSEAFFSLRNQVGVNKVNFEQIRPV